MWGNVLKELVGGPGLQSTQPSSKSDPAPNNIILLKLKNII